MDASLRLADLSEQLGNIANPTEEQKLLKEKVDENLISLGERLSEEPTIASEVSSATE